VAGFPDPDFNADSRSHLPTTTKNSV